MLEITFYTIIFMERQIFQNNNIILWVHQKKYFQVALSISINDAVYLDLKNGEKKRIKKELNIGRTFVSIRQYRKFYYTVKNIRIVFKTPVKRHKNKKHKTKKKKIQFPLGSLSWKLRR
jgi:hypothetical protein